jgi:hypothetical protein
MGQCCDGRGPLRHLTKRVYGPFLLHSVKPRIPRAGPQKELGPGFEMRLDKNEESACHSTSMS